MQCRKQLVLAFVAMAFIVFVVKFWFGENEDSFSALSLNAQGGPECESRGDYDGFEQASLARKEWSKDLHEKIELVYEVTSGNLTEPEGHKRFDILGPIGPMCKHLDKFGGGDEEKRACGLVVNAKSRCCVVFSIGSSNQWSFEESLFKSTKCLVHVFDCTVAPTVKPPKWIQSRVKLHNVCIGDKDFVTPAPESRSFMTWESILNVTKLSYPPTFLKMDIEGWEYPVLKQILQNGKLLPRQIGFELHYKTYPGTRLPWANRAKSSGELAVFMDYLYRFGNYFLVDRHDNKFCLHCSELLVSRFCE